MKCLIVKKTLFLLFLKAINQDIPPIQKNERALLPLLESENAEWNEWMDLNSSSSDVKNTSSKTLPIQMDSNYSFTQAYFGILPNWLAEYVLMSINLKYYFTVQINHSDHTSLVRAQELCWHTATKKKLLKENSLNCWYSYSSWFIIIKSFHITDKLISYSVVFIVEVS